MYKKKEKILKGIGVSPGISIAPAFYYVHEVLTVSQNSDGVDVEKELLLYEKALNISEKAILRDKKKALKNGGVKAAEIFDTHILLLKDQVLIDQVKSFITQKSSNASYAVSKIMKGYQTMLEKSNNEYLSQRAFDVEDVCRRIVRQIFFQENDGKKINLLHKQQIVVSKNILPSDTVNLGNSNTLGFVTELGGDASHAAILARSMGIPAVVGVKKVLTTIKDNDRIIVDGNRGNVIVNPSEDTIIKYEKLKQRYQDRLNELSFKLQNRESFTRDGERVNLSINIQTENEIGNIKKFTDGGVGLFRTEFVFERKTGILSEDEQFKIFDSAAKAIYPDKLIIRLFDIGGDKLLGKFSAKEDNPFLGLRGLRLLFDRKDLLIPHLRAILRASENDNLKLLVPFITSINEIKALNRIVSKASKDLIKEGFNINPNLQKGIMLEIPSAVIMVNELAKYCDFFSIGTNDLTQYTLAADRGNSKVAYIFNSLDPAVLRLIKTSADAALKRDMYISVCGLMAGVNEAVPILLGLGIKNLSVSTPVLPIIKDLITKLDTNKCKVLANKALKMDSYQKVKLAVQKFFIAEGIE
ncbi:MAG: phosphoenolpyruvate--protein phosphotransferase [Candidatus Cloacimonadota bacterium]|nr:MAG: phosphoenolpyruvate--protein phosphotransferase [Candidatus Cloacimonadota bacterium]PIE79293.1 MAG: phosphoenolpyruvate--protein phosphotransferase [Candidatus Delongbacteria bacterium]